MGRCSFAVDEHVPRAWVSALESNGFSVRALPPERIGDTDDESLLRWSAEQDRVLLTNDRDFLELDQRVEHAGIIVYATPSLSAGAFVRGIRRIDTQFPPETIRNELVWLDEWL